MHTTVTSSVDADREQITISAERAPEGLLWREVARRDVRKPSRRPRLRVGTLVIGMCAVVISSCGSQPSSSESTFDDNPTRDTAIASTQATTLLTVVTTGVSSSTEAPTLATEAPTLATEAPTLATEATSF